MPSDRYGTFPEGTSVTYKQADNSRVRDHVISTPKFSTLQDVPATFDQSDIYTIKLATDKIVKVPISEMTEITVPSAENNQVLLPTWMSPKQKMMFLKDREYNKGYPTFEDLQWRFSYRKIKGTEK